MMYTFHGTGTSSSSRFKVSSIIYYCYYCLVKDRSRMETLIHNPNTNTNPNPNLHLNHYLPLDLNVIRSAALIFLKVYGTDGEGVGLIVGTAVGFQLST